MKEIIILNNNENNEINCTLNLGSKEDSALIIMCYGLNGNKVCQHRIAVKLEREFERNQIDMIRFDYTNVGTSHGYFEKSTLNERIQNVKDIIDFTLKYYIRKKVFLLGFSDGARIAMQASIFYDLEGLILWNPIFNIPIDNNEPLNLSNTNKFIIHPLYKIPVKELLGVGINMSMLKEIKNDNTYQIFTNTKSKKIIALYGTNDELSYYTKSYLENTNLNIDIDYIDGADHLFNRKHWENSVINKTIAWIKRNI